MIAARLVRDVADARQALLAAVRAVVTAVTPVEVADEQYVQVADLALPAGDVFGRSHAELLELPITGWQLDPAFEPFDEKRRYGMYSVAELAARQPVWTVPLVLPVGWSFHCADGTLVNVLSPTRTVVPVELTLR